MPKDALRLINKSFKDVSVCRDFIELKYPYIAWLDNEISV